MAKAFGEAKLRRKRCRARAETGKDAHGFHRTSRGGIRGAEVSRLRSGRRSFGVAVFWGAAGGFASFCGGNPRASSGRGDVRRREMCSLRCESPTAALSLALSIGDGGGRLCRSVKIWKAGERRGAARAGRDAERERARLSSDEPRRKRPRWGGMCAPETKERRLRGWARLRGALCSVWRGARRVRHLERGDVRRRGTGVQQEMRKTRKSGAQRRACGAGRACAMTCSRKFRAVLP